MLITSDIRYGYNDVMIRPAVISTIASRSECNPYDEEGFLPIFTAPMSSVVDIASYQRFENARIHTIIPRSVQFHTRELACRQGCWVAFSLSEFEQLFCNPDSKWVSHFTPKVLIDIANGHMMKMYQAVRRAKEIYGTDGITVMVGNIANPQTIKVAAAHGVDYIRISIGAGAGCITASNTGVYDAPASLLDDCYSIKKQKKLSIKLVADGGIRSFSDINKALALGADYVMIGGMLSQLVGSAGEFWYTDRNGCAKCCDNEEITVNADGAYVDHCRVFKKFYGMASAAGQKDISGEKTKTSEGIEKMLPCTTSIEKWADNAAAYLRSAMSYCGVQTLNKFNPDNIILHVISPQSKQSINL